MSTEQPTDQGQLSADPADWLTTGTARRRAGVSLSTIWRWLQAGLASYRLEGSQVVIINRADLDAWIRSGRPDEPPATTESGGWLTAQAACVRARIVRATLGRWMRRGLKFYRPNGGRVLIDADDLNHWIITRLSPPRRKPPTVTVGSSGPSRVRISKASEKARLRNTQNKWLATHRTEIRQIGWDKPVSALGGTQTPDNAGKTPTFRDVRIRLLPEWEAWFRSFWENANRESGK